MMSSTSVHVREFILSRQPTIDDLTQLRNLGVDVVIDTPRHEVNTFGGRPQYYVGRTTVKLTARTESQVTWLGLLFSPDELILTSEYIQGV